MYDLFGYFNFERYLLVTDKEFYKNEHAAYREFLRYYEKLAKYFVKFKKLVPLEFQN